MRLKGILITTLTFLLCSSAIAQVVKVFPSDKNPLVGEIFKLVFTIESQGDGEPSISFDPSGANVIGKRNEGVSTHTTIINGKFSTKRSLRIAYDVVSSDARPVTFRNIKVVIGGTTHTHPDVSVNLTKTTQKKSNYFVLAIPDKEEIYLGEGINVRYYLYYKTNYVAYEIEKFPTFNGFTKRFKTKINETPQRVNYEGEQYLRSLKYEARIFPEKTGELKLDPLRLKVQFAQSGNFRNNPFRNFGFRNLKVRSLASPIVKVKVAEVPTENMPANYTGLIGKHNFQISLNKNKFVVNEAIELTLKVTGPGALESYGGPKILFHENLEEFETKYDLQLGPSLTGTKAFEYTYLARGPVKFESRKFPFVYFDPELRDYVSVEVPIPDIEVLGSSAVGSAGVSPTENSVPAAQTERKAQTGTQLLAPIFSYSSLSLKRYKILIWLLLIIILGLWAKMIWSWYLANKRISYAKNVLDMMKSQGVNYARVHQFFMTLLSEKQRGEASSLYNVIDMLPMSNEAKTYFHKLVEQCEQSSYKGDSFQGKANFEPKYFREALKLES